MTDTINEDDIGRLLPAFYERVRQDDLLGPIFLGAIEDWPHHLANLKDFWSSVMLTTGRYKGRPMVAHAKHASAMTPEAFVRWLTLWEETTEELLPPFTAALFQHKAERIAESLQLGLHFLQERRIVP